MTGWMQNIYLTLPTSQQYTKMLNLGHFQPKFQIFMDFFFQASQSSTVRSHLVPFRITINYYNKSNVNEWKITECTVHNTERQKGTYGKCTTYCV